jgi:hypothetical protein
MTTVNCTDRETWATARTLSGLGELTAQWLEGRIASTPGYYGGPDEETIPLVPVLARLNRAGFVTDTSQPGCTEESRRLGLIEQRAGVQGYVPPELGGQLYDAAEAADLLIVTCRPDEVPRRRYHYDRDITVTKVAGRHFTGFGVRIPRRHIRDRHIGHGVCSREAVNALCSAWQVTFIDPMYGREALLWDVLDGALPEVTA